LGSHRQAGLNLPRRLCDRTVVITGASSGVGQATAIAMAQRHARLALAARDPLALAAARTACEEIGCEAIAIPTDVSEQSAVDALAASTVERFGGIDVWVNNAGVIAYGLFEQTPADVFARVIATNLFGQVNGARAALAQFRRQDSGTLINVSSVWGRVTSPYASSYVTSKFAIRAFSECLREELRNAPDIHVVTVLPQAVDTPIFLRAANFSGRGVRALPLSREPKDIASRIVACSENPKREVTDRHFGRLLELTRALSPPLWEKLSPALFKRVALTPSSAPTTRGNLFKPSHSE
jgi:NAD(P)-dependent dehydrogenase (short-subunit alcohol dehydrogenase family)